EGVGGRGVMGAIYVVESAVGDVLQAPGHAGRAVIFHVRYVYNLRELLRDHPEEERTRVVLAGKRGLDVHIGIETKPGAPRLDASAGWNHLVVPELLELRA